VASSARKTGGPLAEVEVAGGRDLVGVEARILSLQVHNETADGRGQTAASGGLGAEEALHPFGLEANDPALQRVLRGHGGILRALGGRATEPYDRADELVIPLLDLSQLGWGTTAPAHFRLAAR
jgi:hypothetical protein